MNVTAEVNSNWDEYTLYIESMHVPACARMCRMHAYRRDNDNSHLVCPDSILRTQARPLADQV